MKKTIILKTLILIGISIGLSACATRRPEPIKPDRSKADIAMVKGQQRVHADRFAALEATITDLNSRIEKLEFYQVSRKNDIAALRVETQRIEAQRQAQSVPVIAPIQSRSETNSLTTRGANTSAIVPINLLQQDRSNSILNDALDSIQSNRFAIASDILLELKRAGVDSESTPLILFWEGICKEAVFDNKSAIAAYSQLSQQHASHARSAIAMLRQASIFIRIGEKELARLTLEQVTKDYPDSQSAEQAYRKLRDL